MKMIRRAPNQVVCTSIFIGCSNNPEDVNIPHESEEGLTVANKENEVKQKDVQMDEQEDIEPAKDKPKETILKGQDAVFIKDMLLAVSEEIFNELMNNVMQNNTDATERMVARGDLIPIDRGTDVYIVDRSISGLAEVEIVETELRGFVVVEVLEKKNSNFNTD